MAAAAAVSRPPLASPHASRVRGATRTASPSSGVGTSPARLERSSCARCASRTARSVASEASERDVCRICQSESGLLVHPCVCDGSMGGMHERCLAQWYAHSGNNRCEICLTEYARTARVLRPLREWARPQITSRALVKLLALICSCISLYQISALIVKRRTYERLVLHGIGPRSHDYGRFIVFFALFTAVIATSVALVVNIVLYVRAQFDVRFTEHEKHRRSAAGKKGAFFG